MSVISALSENIKKGIRSWLNITPAGATFVNIIESMDFELHCIRNRIWYRGDSSELQQYYAQATDAADRYKFWASKCSEGMEMRKIHTGLPQLMVGTLVNVVMSDFNKVDFTNKKHEDIWDKISEQNDFENEVGEALSDTIYLGGGAWKVSIDTNRGEYPFLEWYPADRVEYTYNGSRVQEITFKIPYKYKNTVYTLHEHYGYGYILYHLYKGEDEIPLSSLPFTEKLSGYTFDNSLMLAKAMMLKKSTKFEGRGASLFDGKIDNFDAFDEVWSQWMDALRAGRAKTYIPECFIPRNEKNGMILKPNAFDNRFIAGNDNMGENGKNIIQTEQPDIPHESYLSSYITALDMCLQGILSPSTLGIDTKKLDNAEAQREKEKTTLYTRNMLISVLQKCLPDLIESAINGYYVLQKVNPEKVECKIQFGEYASPSFESQVETIGRARTDKIMSLEAAVEELYGDTKEKQWKDEEVARLKEELGIAQVEEPGVNMAAGDFTVNQVSGDAL